MCQLEPQHLKARPELEESLPNWLTHMAAKLVWLLAGSLPSCPLGCVCPPNMVACFPQREQVQKLRQMLQGPKTSLQSHTLLLLQFSDSYWPHWDQDWDPLFTVGGEYTGQWTPGNKGRWEPLWRLATTRARSFIQHIRTECILRGFCPFCPLLWNCLQFSRERSRKASSRPERGEEVRHVAVWRKSVTGPGNRNCKDCVPCARDSAAAAVAVGGNSRRGR